MNEGLNRQNLEKKPDIREKMGALFHISGSIRSEGGSRIEDHTTEKDERTFARNNDLLCFVIPGGVPYVTRFSAEKLNTLISAGYKESENHLAVPFSNGERPDRSEGSAYDRWEKMMNG